MIVRNSMRILVVVLAEPGWFRSRKAGALYHMPERQLKLGNGERRRFGAPLPDYGVLPVRVAACARKRSTSAASSSMRDFASGSCVFPVAGSVAAYFSCSAISVAERDSAAVMASFSEVLALSSLAASSLFVAILARNSAIRCCCLAISAARWSPPWLRGPAVTAA